MAAGETALPGEWRQVKPDPHPAAIFLTFEPDGALRYRIEADTVQHILLTWRVEGDTIISDQPSAPQEQRTRFSFAGPDRLLLDYDGEMFAYERV